MVKQVKQVKIDERYLEIKEALEKQKQEILADAGAIINSNLKSDNKMLPDLSDQASAETDQNFTLRIKEREQKLLRKIENTLDRIGEGTFGICEECGEEINISRLKARPVTSYCIDCKTRQEEFEKQLD